MRITMITPFPIEIDDPRGGVEAAVAGLVPVLGSGPEVDLVIVAPGASSQRSTEHHDFGTVIRVPLRPGVAGWVRDLHGSVVREVRSTHPDLVHIQGWCSLMAHFPSAVLTIHGISERDALLNSRGPRGIARFAALWLLEGVPRHLSRRVIAISQHVYDHARRTGARTWLIPNAIPDAYFRNAPSRDPATFLMAGAISPLKNVEGAIRSFDRVSSRLPEAQLIVVGPGVDDPCGHHCQQVASRLPAADRIKFLGPVDRGEMATLLARATTLVSFSNQENAPMVIAEAIATGAAVVGTDVGDVRRMIGDLPGCHVVPPGDERLLAEAMVSSVLEWRESEAEVRRARAEVHRPGVIADATLRVYRECLQTSPSRELRCRIRSRAKRLRRYGTVTGIALRYVTALGIGVIARRCGPFKDVWLIAERGTDARDNGYHLARYISAAAPSVNLRFVISPDSPDRERLASFVKAVNRGSWLHYLYFAVAKVRISTHIMGFSPDASLFRRLDRMGLVGGHNVSLKHGIIMSYIPYVTRNEVRLSLLVCGAAPEYDFVSSTYGFEPGVVRYLGLCRFDELHDFQPSRTILIMPTWRRWLSGLGDEAFTQSDYFRRYQGLIANPAFHDLLERHDFTAVFYPHHEVQRYLHLFNPGHPRVTAGGEEHFDVQSLLKRAAVLVTDYSSVHFDFAYMGKPIVYYQFDPEDFRQLQYPAGYFEYGRDGFGRVVDSQLELVAILDQSLSRGCRLASPYNERRARFFPLFDANNCERNFEAIVDVLGKPPPDLKRFSGQSHMGVPQ